MPIVSRGRSLTPANARASDVAARMVEHLAPIQQQRMEAAFRVQGIESQLYHYLHQGRPCTCKSTDKQLSGLTEDGKAPQGVINRLLTGNEFSVTPYTMDSAKPKDDAVGDFYNPNAFVDFDVVGNDPTIANHIVDEATVGDNGAFDPETINDLIGSFDPADAGYSDVSCPVCFGSNYVGGYSSYHGFRLVLTPTDVEARETIDFQKAPWELNPCTFSAVVQFPRGAAAVDAFRVFRGQKCIPATFSIDTTRIANEVQVLAFCDGFKHILTCTIEEPMTHVEIQLCVNPTSVFFEIPKLSKNSDLTQIDSTDPFQILLSPDVPLISSLDVIVESQQGKALLVQSVTPWQTRTRSTLGWECQVRMVQPQELYRILPLRGKIHSQKVANKVKPTISKNTSGF